MPLDGSAFLALWNDVDPARDAEYDAWHTIEHVPERVGIAGFLSGRRYVARERSDDRYFTLYEIDALGALAGPAYADVVNHPTAWTRSMRPALRNFHRYPCATLHSVGGGIGGCIAALRVDAAADGDALDAAFAQSLLAPYLDSEGVTSLHLGRAQSDPAFPLRNAVKDAAHAGNTYVLLIEGVDRPRLAAAATRIAEALRSRLDGAATAGPATFDLACVIRRSDLRHPTTGRQPPRRGP